MSVGIIKESLFMDDFSFNFIYESRLVFGDTEQNYCNVKSGFVLYLLHISRSLTQVLRVFSMIFLLVSFRYLCEYIYYTSLSVNNTCTLFVHVPDLTIYSSEEIARGLEKVLDLCMKQLIEVEDSKEVAEKLRDSSLRDGGNAL